MFLFCLAGSVCLWPTAVLFCVCVWVFKCLHFYTLTLTQCFRARNSLTVTRLARSLSPIFFSLHVLCFVGLRILFSLI